MKTKIFSWTGAWTLYLLLSMHMSYHCTIWTEVPLSKNVARISHLHGKQETQGSSPSPDKNVSLELILVEVYSHTFTLLWSRKASLIAEIYLYFSVCVCLCVFHLETTSFFGKSFLFLFLFIVFSVLRYCSFHAISQVKVKIVVDKAVSFQHCCHSTKIKNCWALSVHTVTFFSTRDRVKLIFAGATWLSSEG